MTRWCARLTALLLLVGLVALGAPCPCADASAPGAADHCGVPAAGVRAAHGGCACPCMTPVEDVADRPQAEARAPLAAAASATLPRGVGIALALPTPRARRPPERATASPPSVLRI